MKKASKKESAPRQWMYLALLSRYFQPCWMYNLEVVPMKLKVFNKFSCLPGATYRGEADLWEEGIGARVAGIEVVRALLFDSSDVLLLGSLALLKLKKKQLNHHFS